MKKIAQIMLMAMAISSSDAWAKVVEEHIFIVPAGVVDQNTLKAIKTRLPALLSATTRVEIKAAEKIPEEAYNPARKQYDAVKLLDYISGRITIATTTETVLIIVDVDLYTPESEFVFGYADPKKVMCVLSLFRLRNEFYGMKPDRRLFIDRVMKEALHTLGGAWGLAGCSNKKCAMYLSSTLPDTDGKRDLFCHDCRKRLRRRYIDPMFNMPQF